MGQKLWGGAQFSFHPAGDRLGLCLGQSVRHTVKLKPCDAISAAALTLCSPSVCSPVIQRYFRRHMILHLKHPNHRGTRIGVKMAHNVKTDRDTINFALERN